MTLALVVGCSEYVWDEVEAAQKLADYHAYYVCKMAGIHWDEGRFVWLSLHPEYMPHYQEKRRDLGLPDCYETVVPLINEVGSHWQFCKSADRCVTYRWPGMSASGSSGLFAVKVALDDGHDRVVLAGVPMLRNAKHFARGQDWLQRDCFMDGWKQAMPHIRGKVRSLSGWTMQTLGAPTPEWLAEAREATSATGRDAQVGI